MDEKSLNPVFFWLSENLFTEQAIAEQKKDLDSLALTLSAEIGYSEKDLKAKFASLYEQLIKENFKVKYLIASSILLYLSKKYRLKIKSHDVTQIKGIITSLHEIRLPFKYKILAYYFSEKFDKSLSSQLEKLLISERSSFLHDDDFDDLIEVEFALGERYFSKGKWDNFDIVGSGFDIGKLAKLGLLYHATDQHKTKLITNLVERKIWQKISTTSLPTISLLVYEAEKLISTNLPTGELNQALELLKKQNKDWAKLISHIQTEGITVDLKNFNHISGLNPEDACWAVNLLKMTDREKTYQLSSGEYREFTRHQTVQEKGAMAISKYSIIFFTCFVSLILILSYIYFVQRHGLAIGLSLIQNLTNPNTLWQNIKSFSWNFDSLGAVITSPPAVLFVVCSTLWRSWLYLSKTHKFGVKYAVKAILALWEYK